MRRFVLIGVLAVAVIAAVAATAGAPATAGAGDQRTSVGGGVSVVLPTGWRLTHGSGTPVTEPIPRLSAATFAVRWSARHCVCDTPHVANFPRDGAFVFVWEYSAISARDRAATPGHPAHFRIGGTPVSGEDCTPSDTVLFREGDRGFQVEIYLGPDAPASARAQIAAILSSWRVTSVPA